MKSQKKYVTTHEAKTHLSRLLQRVSQGEEIVIARGNEPIARLVPYEKPATARKLGRDKGVIWTAADFDAPLPPDILSEFEK
ncbi:MAG: type II toxin-antitoxin system Phd/YefM family antitoxin [Bdellovibrionota bacterium]